MPSCGNRVLQARVIRYSLNARVGRVEAGMACGVSRHRLDQLRDLAVDLETAGRDFLQLVRAVREPAIDGHAGVGAEEIDFEIISGLDEPEILVRDRPGEVELVERAGDLIRVDCRLSSASGRFVGVVTTSAFAVVAASEAFAAGSHLEDVRAIAAARDRAIWSPDPAKGQRRSLANARLPQSDTAAVAECKTSYPARYSPRVVYKIIVDRDAVRCIPPELDHEIAVAVRLQVDILSRKRAAKCDCARSAIELNIDQTIAPIVIDRIPAIPA